MTITNDINTQAYISIEKQIQIYTHKESICIDIYKVLSRWVRQSGILFSSLRKACQDSSFSDLLESKYRTDMQCGQYFSYNSATFEPEQELQKKKKETIRITIININNSDSE